MCLCVCIGVCMGVYDGQRIVCRNWFTPSTMWDQARVIRSDSKHAYLLDHLCSLPFPHFRLPTQTLSFSLKFTYPVSTGVLHWHSPHACQKLAAFHSQFSSSSPALSLLCLSFFSTRPFSSVFPLPLSPISIHFYLSVSVRHDREATRISYRKEPQGSQSWITWHLGLV